MAGKKKGKQASGAVGSGASAFGARGFGAKGFGTKVNFQQEITKVRQLCHQERFPEANRYLQELNQRYPQQVELLKLHLSVAVMGDDKAVAVRVAARLLELRPRNADALYVMAVGAVEYQFLFLVWYLGQLALAEDAEHPMSRETQELVARSGIVVDEMVAEMNLPRTEAIEAMVLHEWAQFHLEWQEFEQVETLERQVLAIAPQFWPAYNNLSLANFMSGNLTQAIDWVERVLAVQPDNIHALANQVRYSLLSGKAELAQEYGRRLKQSQADSWDPVTKKIEALSYLNDTVGILAIWDEAKADAVSPKWSAMLLHWVAVAKARNGQAKEADGLWLKALKRSPNLAIAQQNREDAKKSLGERHGPWAFEMSQWLPPDLEAELRLAITSAMHQDELDTDQLTEGFEQLYHNYPNLGAILELLFERGDPVGRETALQIVMTLQHPPLMDMLCRFALGQNGPDQMRYRAVQALIEADYLNPEKVRMWLKGQWQEVMVSSYEIHDEPFYDHPQSVLIQLEKVLSLLRTQEVEQARQAEQLLQELLVIQSTPDLINNLAISYQVQGRDEEAIALSQQLVADYPDYIPARLTLAQYHLRADEIEAAEELVLPILKIRRMHYKNFVLFSQMYLRLCVVKKEVEKAQVWLKLWKQLMPDHPLQKDWAKRLMTLSTLEEVRKMIDNAPDLKRKGRRTKKV